MVGSNIDLNEYQTRKQKIDVLLREQGWDVSNRSQVIPEVDTKQSCFIHSSFKTISDTLRNDLESKYADYLLLDGQGAPLAIIEAKRTTKDPLIGKKQAEQYADDIKKQTGKDVFIFLSNGYEVWFWDRTMYPLRQLKGFYTQRDLERLRFQDERIIPDAPIDVNTSIVDRSKSIENVKRIVETIHKGQRKTLIVMATGTGKTRVAMAIIDALMKENRAQKVLFLADRRALRDQAWSKGLLEFFPQESKEKILKVSSTRLSVCMYPRFRPSRRSIPKRTNMASTWCRQASLMSSYPMKLTAPSTTSGVMCSPTWMPSRLV